MPRATITVQRKLTILRDADERQLNNKESLKSIARSHGVQAVQIRNWRKQREVLSLTRPRARSLHKGKPSTIKYLEDAVIGHAFEMRQIGVGITYNHLVIKACQLDEGFRAKTYEVQYQLIRRLCNSNCLVNRRRTHVSQEHPQEAIDRAEEWLSEIRPILSAPNVLKEYIINMDQTPLPFSLASSTTLELEGEKTVTVRQTGNSKTRCTVSLTITADGGKLKPMIIFKGQRGGTIATRELAASQYRDNMVLSCQSNAWQDEENMNDWVDGVLVPHLQQHAAGSPVYLFLDQFAAHDTASFRTRMDSLGVTLKLIPGKCTWVLQPIDVGIGKPFKDRVRQKWFRWMINHAEADVDLPNASTDEIQQWVNDTWQELPEDIVRNSWKKSNLSWFV
ncbi:DDE superfamily endonuclease [Nitzschia inconspicua]|uniref:DDE superfamily endonuclease n=1 Tax=Nitzschia inconspicua TaxID=303405 RepID=A0A9K3LPM7_9STRA|nr:DDE superfamily endonuclease [Nitzschia inconspicua]KAG7367943.1 DDE superfamily endonuclease [Nitzschia inconspicua]